MKLASKAQNWIVRFSLLALPITAIPNFSIQPANAANGCSGSDCVVHELSTQAICTQNGTESVPLSAVGTRLNWYAGLNTNTDQKNIGQEIVAYKIRWFNGAWSNWYVTGVNDLDVKFNTNNNTMRRMWSYFTDHQHLYISCK